MNKFDLELQRLYDRKFESKAIRRRNELCSLLNIVPAAELGLL